MVITEWILSLDAQYRNFQNIRTQVDIQGSYMLTIIVSIHLKNNLWFKGNVDRLRYEYKEQQEYCNEVYKCHP